MHLQSIVGRRIYFNPLLFSRPFDELLSIQIILLLLISPPPYYFLSFPYFSWPDALRKKAGWKKKTRKWFLLLYLYSPVFCFWPGIISFRYKKRERERHLKHGGFWPLFGVLWMSHSYIFVPRHPLVERTPFFPAWLPQIWLFFRAFYWFCWGRRWDGRTKTKEPLVNVVAVAVKWLVVELLLRVVDTFLVALL